MPGHEKMVSVTIAPASSAPNCTPKTAMIGIVAFAQGAAVDYVRLGKYGDKIHRSFAWWLPAALEHAGLRMTSLGMAHQWRMN
jgi:hypothetical protein